MKPPQDTSEQATIASRGGDVPSSTEIRISSHANRLDFDFGDYELVGELGRGGMGVVYKARQKSLDRFVALKVISSGRLALPEEISRFRDEARAAARLQHPHVVRIYDVGESRGHHFFVMEYIAGKNLMQYAQEKKLNYESLAEVMAIVARTVDHLHKNGIVHRDLKPSNILLDEQRRPLVTDFGLAMMLEQEGGTQERPQAIAGTPSYMSPEQAAGEMHRIDTRTDVYSLGAILYELLTGRPPFRGSDSVETILQVIENEPEPPSKFNPKIPHDLEMICRRALMKRPEHRYPSAAALAEDLEAFLQGGHLACPMSPTRRLLCYARRHVALSLRVSGLLACASIAIGNYYLSGDVSLRLHLQILGVLGAWLVISGIFQWMLQRPQTAEAARLAWSCADILLLTLILKIDDAFTGPLVVGYPLLIAGAALWEREAIIWVVTALSLAGYTALGLDAYLRGLPIPRTHWHLVFVAVLVVMACIASHQVRHSRRLARCQKLRLPGVA